MNNLEASNNNAVTYPNALSNILIIEFPFFKLHVLKQRAFKFLIGAMHMTFVRNIMQLKAMNSRLGFLYINVSFSNN